MSKEEERLEEKFTIINEALLTGASANSLAKKYGVDQTVISRWLRGQGQIVQECL